jgi:hypothetical protein
VPTILRTQVPSRSRARQRKSCWIRVKPGWGRSPNRQQTIPLSWSPPRSRMPTTSTAMKCNQAIQGPPSSARRLASQQDRAPREPRTRPPQTRWSGAGRLPRTQPPGRRWLANRWPRTP